MWFVILLLSVLSVGSIAWTLIQIVKPELFFAAENEANLKRIRPKWYLAGGVIGIIAILFLWFNAFQLKLKPVWIFTAIFSLGAVKPIGMVFFYDAFSEKASKVVNKMSTSKKVYWMTVVMRAILSGIMVLTMIYFMNMEA